MTSLAVTLTVDIGAPRHTVWTTLTDPALVTLWFSERTEIDLRPGGTATFYFDGFGEFRAIVEEVERDNAVAYRWAQDTDREPTLGNSTVARFTLEDLPIGTRVTVTETGWEALGKTDEAIAEDMANNARGWVRELDELKALLEKQDSL